MVNDLRRVSVRGRNTGTLYHQLVFVKGEDWLMQLPEEYRSHPYINFAVEEYRDDNC